MEYKIIKTLSDLPSEMILQALDDLKKCEDSPAYHIDMSSWHSDISGKCHVCLAGSVIAQRTDIPPSEEVSPADFYQYNETLYNKLCALDSFRHGRIEEGLKALGINKPESVASYKEITQYSTEISVYVSREKFFKDCLLYTS